MRALLPSRRISAPLNADALAHQPDRIHQLLEPLLDLAGKSDYLVGGSAGEFAIQKNVFQLPRFIFMGPAGGGDTIRLGIFSGFHGDQPEGAAALVEFLSALEREPHLARGYHLYAYPVCNPTGFFAGTRDNLAGQDLTGHFWRRSSQPEIYYLEREMGVLRFQGVISLQTDHEAVRFAGNTGSSILHRALIEPAIQVADSLSQPAASGTAPASASPPAGSRDPSPDFLAATDELDPAPFELHLKIPGQAAKPAQNQGCVGALKSILDSYRSLQSIGQNL